MHYRRAKTSGATYFFTVVTYNRQPVFCSDETIALLRQAFHTVKAESPFAIDAIAVLPDHIYSIWTLPEGDADFSSLACDALKLTNKAEASLAVAKENKPSGSDVSGNIRFAMRLILISMLITSTTTP